MPLKEILNTDGSLAHSTGSTTSGGTFTITSTPSLKSKAEGSPIYAGTLSFSFSGGNSSETLGGTGVVVPGSVSGNGTINPTAQKVKDGGSFVMREGDSGAFTLLTGSFTVTSTGVTSVVTLPNTGVEVSSAGQTKVKGS